MNKKSYVITRNTEPKAQLIEGIETPILQF